MDLDHPAAKMSEAEQVKARTSFHRLKADPTHLELATQALNALRELRVVVKRAQREPRRGGENARKRPAPKRGPAARPPAQHGGAPKSSATSSKREPQEDQYKKQYTKSKRVRT